MGSLFYWFASGDTSEPVYVSELDLPVVYATWRSAQGWGSRRFSVKEVRQMFELPRWIVHVDAICATFSPLLLSAATSDAALSHLSTLSFGSLLLQSRETIPTTAGKPLDPRKRPNTQPDSVRLPALQKRFLGLGLLGRLRLQKPPNRMMRRCRSPLDDCGSNWCFQVRIGHSSVWNV